METCVWVSFQPTYCIKLTVVEPQLELTQQILDIADNSRNVFYECETVIVRYKLTNPGSGATDKATLPVALPEGMKNEDDQSLKIEVGALAAGESVERTIRINPEATGTGWLVTVKGTEKGRGALKIQLHSDSIKDVRSSEPTTVF